VCRPGYGCEGVGTLHFAFFSEPRLENADEQ
jgi:hypothetical protein